MADLLDALEWDLPLNTFLNTAQYERKIYVCEGLEKKPNHHFVMEPLAPLYDAPDGNSSSEDEVVLQPFHVYEGVTCRFAPTGSDPTVKFRVNKERATIPAVREMILVSEQGAELLRIRPKCKPRTRISRGCVELAVSEWMKKQRELPANDPERYVVQSETRTFNINGEGKQVSLWLWKGLEQDVENPDVFKMYL